ncbi:protein serine/threonine kinase, partial [Entamoeba invadens IP1]
MYLVYLLFTLIVHTKANITQLCYALGTNWYDGFTDVDYSNTNNTLCYLNTTNNTYYYQQDMYFPFTQQAYFDTFVCNDSLTLTAIQKTEMSYLNVENFNILSGATVIFDTFIHTNNTLSIDNGTLIINSNFSIANILAIKGADIDKPKVLVWKSLYIHLNYNFDYNKNFIITNPDLKTTCFDVISMNSPDVLTSFVNYGNYNSSLFPIKYTSGIAILISHNRLIRYCPTGNVIPVVMCTMISSRYQKYFNVTNNIKDYPFEYPHCPCDDQYTRCYLNISQTLFEIDLQYNSVNYATMLIEKDITIYNGNTIKNIYLFQDVKLTGDFILSMMTIRL